MMVNKNKKNHKICLLGASFSTSNMGVSALAESSLKIILHRWPDADIVLLGNSREEQKQYVKISDKEYCFDNLPIRFSKNVFIPNHFGKLLSYALLFKIFRSQRMYKKWGAKNPSFKAIVDADIVVDITGGDSFSDIYGMQRFITGFLQKWLVLFYNKKLILLPQTYGPFKRTFRKKLARYILRRAYKIYSRDQSSIELIKKLIRKENYGKIHFAPDVAFILDPKEPDRKNIELIDKNRTNGSVLIGLNVSGLLFKGGYTQNNMFRLNVDYQQFIYDIIELLMKDNKVKILLIPHVFAPDGDVESDPEVCRQIYNCVKEKYSGRISLVHGEYNQNQIKHIIGLCDFFIGSRMHSCIAALSQEIPAFALAYSRKFKGVFESVKMEELVADMRCDSQQDILNTISKAFDNRANLASRLSEIIPDIKQDILKLLDNVTDVPNIN